MNKLTKEQISNRYEDRYHVVPEVSIMRSHSTVTCPHCGYDSTYSILELPRKCPHCGATIE